MKVIRIAIASLVLAYSGFGYAAIIGYVPTTTFNGLGAGSAIDSQVTNAGHTLLSVDLNNASSLSSISGLWLSGGSYSLNATQASNLDSFLNSGRNVVYNTDRSDYVGSWGASTPSVLSLVGGQVNVTGGDGSVHATTGGHSLVSGVSTLRFSTWAAVNPSVGSPELLTSNGMAAVYDWGMAELLFIGDLNWHDNGSFYSGANNAQFGSNIVTFLATGGTVPEPSILALMGLGVAGLGFARRRMK